MISYYDETPDVDQYLALRGAVGWISPSREQVARSLPRSMYSVIAREEENVVGMARIVGDHAFIFFIVDVIVLPQMQGSGIGSGLMQRIMAHIRSEKPAAAYVTLMAAKGKEPFYERFGFFRRPDDRFGCGMMLEFDSDTINEGA